MKIEEFEVEILSEVPEAILLRVTDTIKNLVFEVEMFGPYSGLVEEVSDPKAYLSEQYVIRLATLITDLLYEEEEE